MPTFIFSPLDPGMTTDANTAIVGDHMMLRAFDPNGEPSDPRLDVNALYAVSGEIVTRTMTLRDLSGVFWGSEMEVEVPTGCGLLTEFSFDGGSTYVGSTADWEKLFEWFASGPRVPDRLTLRFTLTSSPDRKSTPWLRRTLFYGEADYDVTEDVCRSIKRTIRTNVAPVIKFRFTHSGGATFVLKTKLDTATLGVYTITARDPSANLVQSYNPANQTVTLTGSVAAGTILEVRGTMADIPVKINPDPDYVDSNSPLYVIRILGEDEGPGKLSGEEEEKRIPTIGDKLGRLIERPTPIDVSVAIDCVADREVEAYAMAREIRKLVIGDDSEGLWQSLGMGYYFDILSVTPIDNMTVPEEGFRDYQVRFVVGAKEYPTSVFENALAEEFDITVHTTGEVGT